MEKYKIIRKIQETPDVITLHFVDKNGKHPSFIAGQYVTVLFPDLNIAEGKAYSISSAPSDPFLALTIKKIGLYSSELHKLREGDELLISQPYGFLNPQFNMPIVMIAGGVGISPLMSIIRDTLEKNPKREIQLWYSNHAPSDIIFERELNELKTIYKQFKIEHFITQDKTANEKYNQGRINIAETISRMKPDAKSFYFICGRESFAGDMWRALVEAEIDAKNIATETFY